MSGKGSTGWDRGRSSRAFVERLSIEHHSLKGIERCNHIFWGERTQLSRGVGNLCRVRGDHLKRLKYFKLGPSQMRKRMKGVIRAILKKTILLGQGKEPQASQKRFGKRDAFDRFDRPI